MTRTDVRCEGQLTETKGGAIGCSLGDSCAVALVLRSFYATRDVGLAQQVRDAHVGWHPTMGPAA